jgi:hypothetical protein
MRKERSNSMVTFMILGDSFGIYGVGVRKKFILEFREQASSRMDHNCCFDYKVKEARRSKS